MTKSQKNRLDGIGAPLPRKEDMRLVAGKGNYAGDNFPDNLCHAVILRSPHAHAHIRGIDVSAAKSAPGVLTVLTGKDASADGIGAIPHSPDWQGPPDAELRLPEGFEVYLTDNTPLPVETVCYVGEGVALVVAETAAEAADAAELIEVDYAPLPAVTDSRSSMKGGAVQIWPDCPSNVALTCEVGDDEAANEAFARAAYIVRLDSRIHRITGSPMEPRAVVGEYDKDRYFYTVRAAWGGGGVKTRERLAVTLGVEKEQCRAVFGDMGGNFGTRNAFSPEFALMPWAARKVGRPVKWTANRTECFLSDYQARDLYSRSELALDTEGNFLALRGENTLNLGAYTVYFWPLRKGLSMMQGTYNIPAIYYKGHAVLTNTAPTAVYRSAGRPEAIYMIERLIDLAAEQHGFDKVDLRRRNLIQSDDMPFTNGVGVTYDSGDYTAAMDA
ncbi:MAG: molybdopterin cofactor-binding domain-containing protein, partial [Pseudomonadota bacterium]|nr:molybdopterin cofactor-binding domain-containing protein [Pseudomonadota bacterium]